MAAAPVAADNETGEAENAETADLEDTHAEDNGGASTEVTTGESTAGATAADDGAPSLTETAGVYSPCAVPSDSSGIEKPGGSDSVAWLEYTFTGNNDYSSIKIHSLDASGEENYSVYASDYGTEESSGSYWLDLYPSDASNRTTAVKVEAEGDWTITLHTEDEAPVFRSGDTISGERGGAFRLEESEDPLTVEVSYSMGDRYSGELSIEAASSSGIDRRIVNTSLEEFKGSVEFPTGQQYISVETYGETWELKAQ